MGHGEFIVIGHSLGSVVAADLLTRLAARSARSPLDHGREPVGRWRLEPHLEELDPFPFGKLDAWVNVYNPWDPVTGGVGLRKRTRRVIDIPIKPFGHGLVRPQPRSGPTSAIRLSRWQSDGPGATPRSTVRSAGTCSQC